jgi:hypothetical protein
MDQSICSELKCSKLKYKPKDTQHKDWIDDIRILAFYGSTPHEVRPVKSGHRVTAAFYIHNDPTDVKSSIPPSVIPPEQITFGEGNKKDHLYCQDSDVCYRGDQNEKIGKEMGLLQVRDRLVKALQKLIRRDGCAGILLMNTYDDDAFMAQQWSGGDAAIIREVSSNEKEITMFPYRVMIQHEETRGCADSGSDATVQQYITAIFPNDFDKLDPKKQKKRKAADPPALLLEWKTKDGEAAWIFPRYNEDELTCQLSSVHDEGAEHTGNESRDESWQNVYFHTVIMFQSSSSSTKKKTKKKTNSSRNVRPRKK